MRDIDMLEAFAREFIAGNIDSDMFWENVTYIITKKELFGDAKHDLARLFAAAILTRAIRQRKEK